MHQVNLSHLRIQVSPYLTKAKLLIYSCTLYIKAFNINYTLIGELSKTLHPKESTRQYVQKTFVQYVGF